MKKLNVFLIMIMFFVSSCIKTTYNVGDCFATEVFKYKVIEVGNFSYKTLRERDLFNYSAPVTFSFYEVQLVAHEIDCFDTKF